MSCAARRAAVPFPPTRDSDSRVSGPYAGRRVATRPQSKPKRSAKSRSLPVNSAGGRGPPLDGDAIRLRTVSATGRPLDSQTGPSLRCQWLITKNADSDCEEQWLGRDHGVARRRNRHRLGGKRSRGPARPDRRRSESASPSHHECPESCGIGYTGSIITDRLRSSSRVVTRMIRPHPQPLAALLLFFPCARVWFRVWSGFVGPPIRENACQFSYLLLFVANCASAAAHPGHRTGSNGNVARL